MKKLTTVLVIAGALTFASFMGAALTPIAQAQFGPPQGGMGIVLPALTGLADGSVSAVTIGWEADTGFFQAADDEVSVAIGGNLLASFEAGWVIRSGGVTATGPGLVEESASATNPSVIPRWDDLDTGVGRSGADALSLIAGGVEGFRITESGTAITSLISKVPQGSIAATCTQYEWFYDTDTTHELCFCTATNTWSCWSATTTSGPTD